MNKTNTTRTGLGRRLAAALLCLATLLSLSACGAQAGGDGIAIPQGMQNATGDGTGYYLFIPSDWRVDHSTGVTVAAYDTARLTFAAFSSEREPAEYWNDSRAETEAMFTDFSLDEEAAGTLLGGAGALRYKFSGIYYDADEDGEKDKYGVTQYICKKDGRMFVLTYMAPYEDDYEQYTTTVEAIVTNFTFAENGGTAEAPGQSAGTGDAPDGMREISQSDIHDFHLYIPEAWVSDLQNGTVSAYVSESDRTSISLVSCYPTEANTLPEYFAYLEEGYKDKLTDYTLLTKEEKRKATTGELDSLRYTFTATYNGVSYKFFQEFFVKGSYVYTFTYTATEELYEGHLTEADSILAAIRFD